MSGPLGPKKVVPQPTTQPTAEQWRKVPGKPWLEVNQNGQLRTCEYKPATGAKP